MVSQLVMVLFAVSCHALWALGYLWACIDCHRHPRDLSCGALARGSDVEPGSSLSMAGHLSKMERVTPKGIVIHLAGHTRHLHQGRGEVHLSAH